MIKNISALGLVAGALSLANQAGATIVYSENFNSSAFAGSSLGLVGRDINSERWGTSTTYDNINNADGWSFSGGTYLAVNTVTGDQGVTLNENGGIANTMVGLSANAYYTLSFNYSGDNRPGEVYGLGVSDNGTTVVSLNNLSWTTQNAAGHTETVTVQANAQGILNLSFFQTTPGGSEASPIIDDITLSTVPEPATIVSGALLLIPFGGTALRILRKKQAA